MSEAYDPGEHTVEEVKEYVEAHPDETAEVLDAEESGKGRVTLLEWLEPREATEADPTEGVPGETDAANDPTVIDESPADEAGNRPEGDREDPNTYPDPNNLPHTP